MIGPTEGSSAPGAAGPGSGLNTAALARIIGHEGEQTGPVYEITIGRPDIDLREHGARIDARMGLNTWAAFAGSDEDARVAGDVAMLEHEVTPVLKALRADGIDIVAIHHHMTGVEPVVIFLHYYGTGPAARLAQAVRTATDLLGKTPAARHRGTRVAAGDNRAPAGDLVRQSDHRHHQDSTQCPCGNASHVVPPSCGGWFAFPDLSGN